MTVVAVIDTGTNSTRLLIADVKEGAVHELMRRTEVTRLGEGVDDSGRLGQEARARVQQTVNSYAQIIAANETEESVILATSSVRDAADGREFLSGLAESHLFSWRLLQGADEAALSFAGATISIRDRLRLMLLDVGGGSTEVVVGRSNRVDYACSMKLGCVRLNERFFRHDPVLPVDINAASEFIETTLRTEVDPHDLTGIERTVAVAGTVTTLAALDLKLKEYDRDAVHSHVLCRENIGGLFDMLAGMTIEQRSRIGTIEPGRADVITAGALIVLKLMEYCEIESVTVSENDILDGAALKLAAGEL